MTSTVLPLIFNGWILLVAIAITSISSLLVLSLILSPLYTFNFSASSSLISANTSGIKSPAVDSLIEKIISANSRAELVTAGRALDRVLSWGFYYVMFGNYPSSRWAYWNVFGRPERRPRFATGFPDTWWIDSVKQEMVASGQPIEVD